MSDSGRRFLSMMAQKMNSDEVKARFAAGMAEELQARLQSGFYQAQLNQIADPNPARKIEDALARLHTQLPAQVTSFAAGFAAALNDVDFEAIAIKSHLQALNEDPIPVARVEGLSGFFWRVMTSQDAVILGDVCVVADTQPNRPLSNVLGIDERLDAVYLPLSTEAVLVGSLRECYEPRSVKELNHASAELSADFFISSRSTDELRAIANHIGNRTPLMSDEEMRSLVPDFSQETIRRSFLEERLKQSAALPKA